MSSILLLDIVNVVVIDSKKFLCIPTSAADAAVVNHNRIKAL